jgi:hypothetical protein
MSFDNYDVMKNLNLKINNLNKKKYYIIIFEFILKNNIEYTRNKNGIFFNINKLNKINLEKLINIVEIFNNQSNDLISSN